MKKSLLLLFISAVLAFVAAPAFADTYVDNDIVAYASSSGSDHSHDMAAVGGGEPCPACAFDMAASDETMITKPYKFERANPTGREYFEHDDRNLSIAWQDTSIGPKPT